MPPKRRSTGAAAKAQQSTLAFHGASNKVTKSGTRAQNAKKNVADHAIAKDSKPLVADVTTVSDDEPTTAEAAIIEQTEQEVKAQKVESTLEEDEARTISDAKIKKYWSEKEKARKAPRVHQEDLSLSEKILREFDMSGQYGVSILHINSGIPFGAPLRLLDMESVLTRSALCSPALASPD